MDTRHINALDHFAVVQESKIIKILFLTTAHNSLSQRLFLVLEATGKYEISIEYAISEAVMIEAFNMFQPDLIICPFLTSKVPAAIYNSVMTLIIHPGPPGDAGPSSLDWVLMGDDGSERDSVRQLAKLDAETENESHPRTEWGISIIQATEQFDKGPVWGFQNFDLDIDEPGLTKSSLYRGEITRAAIAAITRVIERLVQNQNRATAEAFSQNILAGNFPRGRTVMLSRRIHPYLSSRKWNHADTPAEIQRIWIENTWTRPLLKAAEREFDVNRHTAKQISRRIRCADSQPGVLSKIFGPSVYIYGGIIDDLAGYDQHSWQIINPGDIIMTRGEAVCIYTCDEKGIWITHIRRMKRKNDVALWPKIPATSGLVELGVLKKELVGAMNIDADEGSKWVLSKTRTFQEVWIDRDHVHKIAFVHFEFYNGAMSTRQCKLLLEAIKYASKLYWSFDISDTTKAVVLMGGSYFSNGIALNVIEASPNAAQESWENINAIDDVVEYLLEMSRDVGRNILTVAGVRGNAAAGGVAMMAACDLVISGHEVVLNPAYRAIGLSGSEFHTLSYFGRCPKQKATELLRSMLPVSPKNGFLVDWIVEATGQVLDRLIGGKVIEIIRADTKKKLGFWTTTSGVNTHEQVKKAREVELENMSLDFWGPRSLRYNNRRYDFVRKTKPRQTPLRFAKHRRAPGMLDLEETDKFDSVTYWLAIQPGRPTLRLSRSTSKLNVQAKDIEEEKPEDGGAGVRARSAVTGVSTHTGETTEIASDSTDDVGARTDFHDSRFSTVNARSAGTGTGISTHTGDTTEISSDSTDDVGETTDSTDFCDGRFGTVNARSAGTGTNFRGSRFSTVNTRSAGTDTGISTHTGDTTEIASDSTDDVGESTGVRGGGGQAQVLGESVDDQLFSCYYKT